MALQKTPEKSATKKNSKEFGYRIIQIEVTNRCNMGCSFCGLPIRDAKLRDMELDDIFKVLDQIAGYDGIDFVAFHQFGETLLFPDIWKCIDRCRELGLRSQIITNGLLLTGGNINLLLEHPPNLFRISAQSIHPEHHKPMRGVEVDFEVYINRVADCLAKFIDTEHGIDEIRTDLAVNDDRYIGIKGGQKVLERTNGDIRTRRSNHFFTEPSNNKTLLDTILAIN